MNLHRHALRFRAMGTDVHVIVRGGDPLAPMRARDRILALEALWSRFRPASEISAMNRACGRWVPVSSETFGLVRLACDARDATGGRFDPTVLGAVAAAGYDRDFAQVAAAGSRNAEAGTAGAASATPAESACAGAEIELDPGHRMVRLAPGCGFDPGGIGKGLAADVVAAELIGAGAAGALVNLGGDIRAIGEAPSGGWIVSVDVPAPAAVFRVCLADGALATSGTYRRRWTAADGSLRHHLIDPATGRPSATSIVSSTAVAGFAWWAEVAAKAALLAGADSAGDIRADLGVSGCDVTADGVWRGDASFEVFVLDAEVAA